MFTQKKVPLISMQCASRYGGSLHVTTPKDSVIGLQVMAFYSQKQASTLQDNASIKTILKKQQLRLQNKVSLKASYSHVFIPTYAGCIFRSWMFSASYHPLFITWQRLIFSTPTNKRYMGNCTLSMTREPVRQNEKKPLCPSN